jgi:hypothetical protein
VVSEHRARHYPLRPIVTVRLPTLAWIIGLLGPDHAALLLRLLMIAALAAMTIRLRSVAGSRLGWAAATVLATGGMVLLTVPAMTYWHESWSALLIALSLALRSREHWGASLVVGIAAALLRELALPYLALMSVLAWREGGRKEAVGWALGILLFCAAMWAHAHSLSGLVTSIDATSPGWSSGGGWSFVLSLVQRCTVFLFLPLGVVALLVPLALIGWAGVRGGFGERAAMLLLGYLSAFTLLGRPDNFYWGLMIAPLLPIGLAFAPSAVGDLIRTLSYLNPDRRKPAG